MLIRQRAKTPRDEAESHLCKHQQQFLDQNPNPNPNTSWIPLFLAKREKKHKQKNSNMDQNPPSKLLWYWYWFWFDLRDWRSFVWDFANKILIQTHKPLRTLENLGLKREWWSEKLNGYLECWVYEMSELIKRIWRCVRVNRHSVEAWWQRLGDLERKARLGDQREREKLDNGGRQREGMREQNSIP